MKKIISLLIVALMLLCSCQKQQNNEATGNISTSSDSVISSDLSEISSTSDESSEISTVSSKIDDNTSELTEEYVLHDDISFKTGKDWLLFGSDDQAYNFYDSDGNIVLVMLENAIGCSDISEFRDTLVKYWSTGTEGFELRFEEAYKAAGYNVNIMSFSLKIDGSKYYFTQGSFIRDGYNYSVIVYNSFYSSKQLDTVKAVLNTVSVVGESNNTYEELKVIDEFDYYPEGSDMMIHIVIYENQGNELVDTQVAIAAYDKNDNYVGSATTFINAIEPGYKSLFAIANSSSDIKSFKIQNFTNKSEYKAVVNNLNIKETKDGQLLKVVLTNSNKITAEHISVDVLFKNKGEVVYFSSSCLEEDYFSIKSKEQKNMIFACPVSYDEYEIYVSGYGQ